jgi:hypothetical protein
MTDLNILSAILAYDGWAAVGYTMDRHYADLHGRGKVPSRPARIGGRSIGCLALTLSFAIAVKSIGWHIGPVLWCGVLTLSALSITLLLQYAPRLAILAGKLCGIAATAIVLILSYAK